MKRFPERIGAACPPGWTAKVEALAAEADMSRSEWIRALFRRAFEADRKRRARRGTK